MTLSTPEGREIHTALEEAIFLRLGGAVTACHQLGVSTQAVYKLLAIGYVSSRSTALRLEELTGIPAAELMQLAPWTPGRPTPNPRGRKGPNGPSPRPSPVAKLPVGGGTEAGREARAHMRGGVAAKGKRTPPRDNRRACTAQSKSRIVLVGTLRA